MSNDLQQLVHVLEKVLELGVEHRLQIVDIELDAGGVNRLYTKLLANLEAELNIQLQDRQVQLETVKP